MSAVAYYEPYRLPAGLLALAVHGAFFALLYFGFTWQTLPAASMSVELWPSLPDEVVAAPEPVKVEEAAPAEVAPQPVKPEIVLPAKRKLEVKPVPEKPQPKQVASKAVEMKPDTRIADQQAAEAARVRAEQAAEKGKIVNEYMAKIQAKIRRNIVELPEFAKQDIRAVFRITLLPGGAVLKVELQKSSGNEAYDKAAERAIFKSDPLPLPPDVQLFKLFRELKLGVKPTE